jgi:hypothetical protein
MEEVLRDAGVEFTNKDVAEDEEAPVELERIPLRRRSLFHTT